jgi:hypothetical protein
MIAAMTDGFFTRPPHQGRRYQKVLGILHAIRRPRTYLEIGTATGQTLAIAKCASIAIDPNFRLARDVRLGKPACHLFETTSDDFFATQDPRAVLGAPIDLAFIDGMHRYEFALRDFMNVERVCRPNSMIVLHDCLPVDSHMARREPKDRTFATRAYLRAGWAGDTWKLIWILQRYRPDLRLYSFDAPPSGLVVVTGLRPDSTTLRTHYQEAVGAAAGLTLERFYAELEILSTALLRRPRRMLRILPRVRPFDFTRFVRA